MGDLITFADERSRTMTRLTFLLFMMFRPFFRIYQLGRFLKKYTSYVISLELELDAMIHATDNVETVPVCVTGAVLKVRARSSGRGRCWQLVVEDVWCRYGVPMLR